MRVITNEWPVHEPTRPVVETEPGAQWNDRMTSEFRRTNKSLSFERFLVTVSLVTVHCSCYHRARVEFTEKARIMDSARINRALARLASEIVEENHGLEDLVLVGIRRRGVPLANRIADKIADLEGKRPPVGILDITLYRDDLSTVGAKPVVSGTELPGDVEGRCIVLIDDVLYTGRTVRAAIDQLIDFGRPRRVQLAVLIDRGNEHRELPIQADYIGKLVPTKKSEIIKVMMTDFDEEEGVVIVERPVAEAAS